MDERSGRVYAVGKDEIPEWCKLDVDYYGYDGGSELVVKYYRYETDQEEKLRLEKEVEKRKKTQEKEIAELKALKEKYKDLDI